MATVGQVDEYKNTVKKKAEKLVKEKFPERILHCNTLLETSPFYCNDFCVVHSNLGIPVPEPYLINNHDGDDPPGKKRKTADEDEDKVEGSKVFLIPSGLVSINPYITKMVDTIKPIIRTLVEEANILKMWVSFLIPKIEDGNNFGVGIQEDTLGEIRTVESEAAAFFDQISRYYITRAKLVSKVAKYPHIDDYRRSVCELDEKEYLSLRIMLAEIRNHYASLHDMITKNYEKIQKPRPANAIEAIIAGQGEVCIKGSNVFQGYFKDPEKTRETINSQGWLHTGDIGLWLPDGTLKIIDRKNHIFKLSQGEYIVPEKIENIYVRSSYVAQIFVYGESLKSCVVGIIVPDVDEVKTWARSNEIPGTLSVLCNDSRVKQLILDDIQARGKQAGLKSFEQVKDIYLHLDPFSVQNGLLTPTLKAKRPELRKYFKPQLDDLYGNLSNQK